uniref:Uncharacterized protein n=1 Tax=Romanomermis culicivorax TaxID=13658 RepID=A0A915HX24_ROMCU
MEGAAAPVGNPNPTIDHILSAATNCHKSLTSVLKARLLQLDLMYNSTLVPKLKDRFLTLYNQTQNNTQLERNYRSRTYALTTWTSLLHYRLYAKSNKWFYDAMLADQNSTQTSSLLQKYNGCVQTYVEVDLKRKSNQQAMLSKTA